MKFCNNTNFTLPKQSQRSRSILEDRSRSLGLFWKENSPSYYRRNTVMLLHIYQIGAFLQTRSLPQYEILIPETIKKFIITPVLF